MTISTLCLFSVISGLFPSVCVLWFVIKTHTSFVIPNVASGCSGTINYIFIFNALDSARK